MFPAFIIAFREFLEISIILTVILAATRGVSGRERWISIGLVGGLIGAVLIAVFARNISSAVDGVGQEVFNAVVLCVAILMIVWTVVWMQSHGRALAQKIKQVGKAVSEGEVPLYSLAVLVSISIWREGAEIVMFMTGIISTSDESVFSIMTGAVSGALLASILGFMLYLGLVKLSAKYIFSVTGWLLILLACGMSMQMAGYLNAADLLPALGQTWDSGWLLSQNSVLGKILHAMLGYSERPTVMQLIFYATTFAVIFLLLKITKRVKV